MIFPPRKMAAAERLTAADYNNLLDYVRRITPIAGENTKIDYTLSGAKIKSMAVADKTTVDELCPWAVRYHIHENGESAQGYWEIYVPLSAMAIGEPCGVLSSECLMAEDNPAEKSWYQLQIDEEEVKFDADGLGKIEVIAHGKESAMNEGVDLLASGGKPNVAFEVKYISETEEDDEETEEEKKIRAGDVISFVVAVIQISKIEVESEGGEKTTKISRRINQFAKAPINLKASPKALFELVWQYKVIDGKADLKDVYLARTETCIAGYNVVAAAEDLIKVTGYKCIVAKIEALAGSSDRKYTLEIVNEAADAPITSEDNIIKIKLFEMEDNVVKVDARENLNRALVYR